MVRMKQTSILAILILLLLLSGIAAISLGAVQIPLSQTIVIFLRRLPFLGSISSGSGIPNAYETIIFQIRLPRVVLSTLVGAALATAGVILQGLFKNPMADPYVVGVSSGAALGATVSIVFIKGTGLLALYAVPFLAFIGAITAILVVYHLAKMGGIVPISSLLLSGIAVGSFLTAVMTFLMATTTRDLHSVIFWLMGGFSARNWRHVSMASPFFAIGLPAALIFSRELNIMLLGEEKAYHLGIEVETVKRLLLVVASLMAASAVAVSGLIGFVGLMIPHIIRLIIGPDHRLLIPAAALAGSTFLVLADMIARTILAPTEIPVGIVTAFFGAPFFIYLLRLKRKALI